MAESSPELPASEVVVTTTAGFDVTDTVNCAWMPLGASTVIVATPIATAVTRPAFTVTMFTSPDDHVRVEFIIVEPPASATEATTVAVAPIPAITTALGDTVIAAATCWTVTAAVPVTVPDVALIVAAPLDTAVTKPVGDTVAMAVNEDAQDTDAPVIVCPS